MMENREQYLAAIMKVESVLACATKDAKVLASLSASEERQKSIMVKLEAIDSEVTRSRVAFIRRQTQGETAEEQFSVWREKWGIPAFQEGLVEVSDFQNGFMWRFRDHTTSWSENQYAQEWFLTSVEARTVTRYEFWSCDEGPDECVDVLTGSYKQILKQLLKSGVYEVLISSVFSTKELRKYMQSYDEDEHEFTLEEVVEDYISQNPNFVAE